MKLVPAMHEEGIDPVARARLLLLLALRLPAPDLEGGLALADAMRAGGHDVFVRRHVERRDGRMEPHYAGGPPARIRIVSGDDEAFCVIADGTWPYISPGLLRYEERLRGWWQNCRGDLVEAWNRELPPSCAAGRIDPAMLSWKPA